MFKNEYDGVVANWKMELVTSRARLFGFRGHDLDDVQQELVLDVMAFEYDEERSNGATEATALTALIDNRLKMIRRADQRYQNRVNDLVPVETDERLDLERTLLPQDVRETVAELPKAHRELCDDLADGQSVAEIAIRKQCGWHTVKRKLDAVRERFEAAGLNGWVVE